MKNILLINLPGDQIYSRDIYHSFSSKGKYIWQPTDLLYLSGRLKNHFSLEIIDAIPDRLDPEYVLSSLNSKSYHAIIALTGSVSFDSDFDFLKKLTDFTKSPLYILGDFVHSQYKKILDLFPFVTGCIDDFTSPSILSFLKGDIQVPRGMAVRTNEGYTESILPSKERIINIPVPRHDLFPLKSYNQPNNRSRPMATILGSVGCPFKCAFCAQSSRDYKYREPENILKEIDYLYKQGIREILFRDQLIEAIPRNFKALLDGIVKRDYKLGWTCNSRVDTLKPEWFPLMKKAGCHTILFGIENPSERILKMWDTQKNNNQTIKLFKEIRKNDINPCAYFILGLPGEKKEDVLKTIDFAVKLNASLASFSLPSPDFGTRLREIAMKKGYLTDNFVNSDRSLEGTSLNDDISHEELLSLRKLAFTKFYFRPRYFLSTLLSIRSTTQIISYFREFLDLVQSLFFTKIKKRRKVL